MNDTLLELYLAIKNGSDEHNSIYQLAEKIAFKHGIHTPYQIEFKNLDGTENYNDDILLLPGNPVTIVLSDKYILSCILTKRSPIYFRHRLEQAIEKLPRMHRTLSNLIPLSVAIALRKDAKKFVRIASPDYEKRLLREEYLEIDYSVTVRDKVTGTEVRLNGKNPVMLKQEALERLSMTVFERDELVEMLEELDDIRKAKQNQVDSPSAIRIGGDDNEIRERREY